MTDLNISKLNMNSDKYIFKKKLRSRRKSKRRLLAESAFMFITSLFLVYINFLIPNKTLLLQNAPNIINKSYVLIVDLFLNLYEIFLLIFIFISSSIALILLMGSFYRLLKVSKRNSKEFIYK